MTSTCWTLLGAPGLTTRSILTTRNKKLLGAKSHMLHPRVPSVASSHRNVWLLPHVSRGEQHLSANCFARDVLPKSAGASFGLNWAARNHSDAQRIGSCSTGETASSFGRTQIHIVLTNAHVSPAARTHKAHDIATTSITLSFASLAHACITVRTKRIFRSQKRPLAMLLVWVRGVGVPH